MFLPVVMFHRRLVGRPTILRDIQREGKGMMEASTKWRTCKSMRDAWEHLSAQTCKGEVQEEGTGCLSGEAETLDEPSEITSNKRPGENGLLAMTTRILQPCWHWWCFTGSFKWVNWFRLPKSWFFPASSDAMLVTLARYGTGTFAEFQTVDLT